jgi:hypothetical protein
MVALTESACWRLSACSEAPASLCTSAACYGFPEYVRVVTVVVAELELREIEREISLADVVIRADDSALQPCPERIAIGRVDLAAHVLAFVVIYGFVPKVTVQTAVACILIGRYKFNLVTDGLANEAFERFRRSIFDDLADDVARPANRAYNADLSRTEPARSCMFALAFVTISLFPANESFVHFNDAHKLLELRIVHGGAQAMAEIPRRMQRRGLAKKHAPNLTRRNAFLTLQHGVKNLKPYEQWNLRVLEDSSCGHREAVGVSLTTVLVRAFPLPRLIDVVDELALVATRANRTIRPTAHNQEFTTSILSWETSH